MKSPAATNRTSRRCWWWIRSCWLSTSCSSCSSNLRLRSCNNYCNSNSPFFSSNSRWGRLYLAFSSSSTVLWLFTVFNLTKYSSWTIIDSLTKSLTGCFHKNHLPEAVYLWKWLYLSASFVFQYDLSLQTWTFLIRVKLFCITVILVIWGLSLSINSAEREVVTSWLFIDWFVFNSLFN